VARQVTTGLTVCCRVYGFGHLWADYPYTHFYYGTTKFNVILNEINGSQLCLKELIY